MDVLTMRQIHLEIESQYTNPIAAENQIINKLAHIVLEDTNRLNYGDIKRAMTNMFKVGLIKGIVEQSNK